MAHFAEIGLGNKAVGVIAISNNELLDENHIEQEQKGIDFCRKIFGGVWIQTSYNASLRKNFAGLDFTYDSSRDSFIPPKVFDSWVLNEDTCRWEAPVPMPQDKNQYSWDENTKSWVKDF